MKPLRVVHLAYYGYEKTVIDSQVVAPALRLKAEGIDVELVFLEDPLPWLLGRWRSRKAALNAAGLRTHFLFRVPRNFLCINTLRLSSLFGRFLKEQPSLVVHARGIQGAHAVLPIRRRYENIRLICDVRGIDSAEYALDIRTRKGRPLRFFERLWERRLQAMEAEAVLKSDAVFCVSRSMIPRLAAAAGVPETKFDYVPCAVAGEIFSGAQARREAVRRELGLEGKLVFLYAGSLSAWQIPMKMLAVVQKAFGLFEDAIFLGVTPQPAELLVMASQAGLAGDRVRAVRAPHTEVAAFLSAGDIGLLLREENDVNKYACPTKFAEYLACGLPVLATTAVDEVSTAIRRSGAGFLISSLQNDGEIERALRSIAQAARDEKRKGLCDAAARDFDWSRHLPTLKKWYRQLALSSSLPT